MDSLFTFLFKYRALLFERGELTLAAPWPVWAAVAAGLLLAGPAMLSYAPSRGEAGPVARTVLGGLRLLALALLVLCLLQPTLRLTSVVPQRNFVAVLVDDSRSMTVADDGNEARGAFVSRTLADDADLRRALEERFELRFFRFGRNGARIDDPAALGFEALDTRLAPGLELARSELEGVPLSGVVVVSDGRTRDGDELRQALLRARAGGVPVYTVGLGAERLPQDVQVSRVEIPGRVLAGSALAVDVVLEQSGLGGRRVPVIAEEEGREVARDTVRLPEGGEPAVARLHLTATTPGARRFRFSVPAAERETVTRNNAREALVVVDDESRPILYVEGRPRPEVKFLRRAVADDELLRVVVLQRTAEEKYLRLDVNDPAELAGGFPRTREELFGYRGLILGSVEASFFTSDQLRMIADFVARRGGTLLALGGPESFAQGAYAGTPVADALPVVLDETRPLGRERFFAELRIEPTAAGRRHAALRLAGTDGDTARWSRLPTLTTPNPVRELKPGATALLRGSEDGSEAELVALAWQRYGRGKAIAFPVQDSWLWQMHADVAVDDETHETLWRQLLRWMADDAPRPVELRSPPDPADPGRPLELVAEVRDSTYLAVNDARVTARVTPPGGEAREIELRWDGERDGLYRGGYTPGSDGLHRVDLEARRSGAVLGGTTRWIRSAVSDREFFDAGMNGDLLRRIARETGGVHYTPATVDRLPEDLRYTGAGVTVVDERDLWDAPAIFLLLVLLFGTEWSVRRLRGLV